MVFQRLENHIHLVLTWEVRVLCQLPPFGPLPPLHQIIVWRVAPPAPKWGLPLALRRLEDLPLALPGRFAQAEYLRALPDHWLTQDTSFICHGLGPRGALRPADLTAACQQAKLEVLRSILALLRIHSEPIEGPAALGRHLRGTAQSLRDTCRSSSAEGGPGFSLSWA